MLAAVVVVVVVAVVVVVVVVAVVVVVVVVVVASSSSSLFAVMFTSFGGLALLYNANWSSYVVLMRHLDGSSWAEKEGVPGCSREFRVVPEQKSTLRNSILIGNL